MKTRRLLGALATVAVGAAMVPVSLPGVASAAACVAPTNLIPDQGYRTTGPDIKDVTFAWDPVVGANDGYDVEVGLDEDFSSNVLLTESVAQNRASIPVGALVDRSFFWRVRVHGAPCWSDDGGKTAASVTKGWDQNPTPVPGCASSNGIALAAVRFCWKPIADAAYYRVIIRDDAGGVARCFTNQTVLTPEFLWGVPPDGTPDLQAPERRTQPGCFDTTTIKPGHSYTWSVDAIDQGNGLTLDGSPYDSSVSPPTSAPADAPPAGTVTVTQVYPSSGPASGGFLVDVFGSGFVAGSTSLTIGGQTVDKDHVHVVSANELTFTAPDKLIEGDSDVIVTESTSGVSSVVSLFSHFHVGVITDTFTNSELSRSSDPVPFSVAPLGPLSAAPANPTGATATAPDGSGNLSIDCTALDTTTTKDCPTTPVVSWTPVTDANEYRVSLYVNKPTNHVYLLRTYETHSSSIAFKDLLVPGQAGDGYAVGISSCSVSRCNAPVQPTLSFRIRSKPVVLSSPGQGETTSAPAITLSWTDYLATNGSSLEAGQYLVEVAMDCSFSAIVTSGQVDFPNYTATDFAFPDGTYYWRVAVVDASGSKLAYGTAPNRDASAAAADCGDTRHFTVKRSTGTSGAPGGGSTVSTTPTPLALHYGVPVQGLSPSTLQLIETSTQRVVPAEFTLIPDGATLTPSAKDLVPGDYYVLRVLGTVKDLNGNAVTPLSQSPYRAATRLNAPGVYVKLGGAWQSRKAKGSYGGTAVVTTSHKRPSATVRFRGTSVTVGYCKGPANGFVAVYVDGKLKKTVSTYSPFTVCGQPGKAKAPSYTVGKLDGTRQHTITVVETGKQGTRKGVDAAIDWFDIG